MSAGHGQCLQSAPTRVEPAQAPSWKVAYEKVLWESDAGKLLILVHATEDALFLRSQKLRKRSDGQTRTRRNECGAADLLAIKLHKLGLAWVKDLQRQVEAFT